MTGLVEVLLPMSNRQPFFLKKKITAQQNHSHHQTNASNPLNLWAEHE
jgi:hypothetical protein